MAEKDSIQLSKALSRLLRHDAHKERVPITHDGWVEVKDALAWAERRCRLRADEAAVRRIVVGNDKQRFSLSEGETLRIRANQGHSMKGIEVDLAPLKDAAVPAVHGTYYAAWPIIRSEGLSRMRRQHIHLAPDLPGQSGVISGMRSSCELLIWVDIPKAVAAGIQFFVSANGVILTEGEGGKLRPEFFSHVQDRAKGDIIWRPPAAQSGAVEASASPAGGQQPAAAPSAVEVPGSPGSPLADAEKQLRKARKTLRDIEQLRTMQAAGKELEANQLRKLAREQEVKSEIERLERGS